MFFKYFRILMLGVLLILSGCAHHQTIPFEKTKTLYQGQNVEDQLILIFEPLFLSHISDSDHNRIGKPSARYDDQGMEHIPIDNGTTSFYYNKGVLKGHVKGSVKPWESIFMSLLSLDFFVGTDKIYADRKETDNPFYTSLKPWNREASDMWDFATFLKFWGWRL